MSEKCHKGLQSGNVLMLGYKIHPGSILIAASNFEGDSIK